MFFRQRTAANATLSYLFDCAGQRLVAGNVLVAVSHTPGHTPDGICLVVRDLRRRDEPWFVVTGNASLVGAFGRTDLAGGEHELAAQLHDMLHQRLLTSAPELDRAASPSNSCRNHAPAPTQST